MRRECRCICASLREQPSVQTAVFAAVLHRNDKFEKQLSANNQHTFDEIAKYLLLQRFILNFCVFCYRKNETDEHFMNFAKPGEIKYICDINSFVTLKEYLGIFCKV